MAKRPKVPTALHSELTEYSSLLRALRTSSTLDLAQHLTDPTQSVLQSPSLLDEQDELLSDGREAPSESSPLVDTRTRDLTSEVASSVRSRTSGRARGLNASGKAKQKDTWTRWPLLAGDVHVPEWGLQEEVRHVAQQVLASVDGLPAAAAETDTEGPRQEDPITPRNMDIVGLDDDYREHPALSPVALRALTSDSAAFITRILALVAAHVPNADKSMQHRIRPINWETVVDVACAHGVVDSKAAARVRSRMAHLYPPAQPDIIHRVDRLSAMKNRLNETLLGYDASLLTVPGQQTIAKAPSKPARNTKKREASPEASSTATKRHRSDDV
ncbi:hypothetical protein PYCCODRAFT_1469988 [Trametes coccinea BRFM310]|uniref:Uncharacterized protein n=1 Tax=Trametes coccinea (strain BRFM310) TaxID=1353009 RepID=A0A1Y2IF03_TRAC3|nr:hypothetical protein PYCCODRAFT_1469988 [Trametes coccinea BRFM310]